MSNQTKFASNALRHFPKLERLESRLAPGDALLGLLAGWPDSVPVVTAECPEAGGTSGFEMDDVVPDGTLWMTRSEPWTPQPRFRRPSDAQPAIAIDDAIHGFANTSIAHVSNRLQMTQSLGATIGGLTSAAQGMGNPSLALQASAQSRIDIAATPVHRGSPREQGLTSADQSHEFGELPLMFEANVGHTDGRVDFVARAAGYTAFLTATGPVFAVSEPEVLATVADDQSVANASGSDGTIKGVALHMNLVGTKPATRAAGVNPLSGKVNYFIGNNPSQWRTNIATFGRVEYEDVYPGIDLVYYGKDQQLEYDFIVSPGVDPDRIALNFAGADGAEIDGDGNLVLHTAAGDFVQQKPYLYQESNGIRQEVAGRFVLTTHPSPLVTFDVGQYDATRPLVIDPLVLGYSTYLGAGGAFDGGHMIAVDAVGNSYVGGTTSATNFPVTPGAFDTTSIGGDAFIAKLNPAGSALVYATYIGGNTGGECNNFNAHNGGIAVDSAGSAYLACKTISADFPTTPGAFDTTYGGDIYGDGFVLKLSPDGASLDYSTYFGGGANADYVEAIALHDGDAYVVGHTWSSDFPTTPGAFDTTWANTGTPYLLRLNGDGSALVFSTFLGVGAEARGVAVDTGGNAYTVSDGDNVFVQKISANGATQVYGMTLGGSSSDDGLGIAVDTAGRAFIVGQTHSGNFSVTPGAYDTTYNGISKINAAGNFILYSTYIGGSLGDEGRAIAVSSNGDAYVTGWSNSNDFPTTPGTFDATHDGLGDAIALKILSDGSALSYSTYLGGPNFDSGRSIALDSDSNAYITGRTTSGFPITPGALKKRNRGTEDAFVTKLVET